MEAFNKYFLDIVKNHYADFEGRARRREYWMFTLMYLIVYVALAIVGGILSIISSTLGSLVFGLIGLASLAVLIPSIAVTVRRLHDVDKSGWFILVSLIPVIGGFYLLYLTIIEGTKGDNQYGSDPKAGE